MCLYIVQFYTIYMHIQYDMYCISYDIDNYEKSNEKINKSYLNKIGFRIESLMWVKKKNSQLKKENKVFILFDKIVCKANTNATMAPREVVCCVDYVILEPSKWIRYPFRT